jgi:GNAT superfamily N-acetyltransferase
LKVEITPPGDTEHLGQINEVVSEAVLSWPIADRVRRLALPSYLYDASDVDAMRFHMARAPVADGEKVVGVAAYEPADPSELPEPPAPATADARRGWLLHGLFVRPDQQRRGVGWHLLASVVSTARQAGIHGIVVKANRHAVPFFEANGFNPLAPADTKRDYPHRYWLSLR